jgi:hypothetical protein
MEANAGVIRAKLVLSNEEFKRKMADSRNEMKGMGKDAKQTSKDLKTIQTAALGVATAVGGAIAASVATAANFEQSMSKLAGITNASTEDLARLEQAARDMGATTAFSARDYWPVSKRFDSKNIA